MVAVPCLCTVLLLNCLPTHCLFLTPHVSTISYPHRVIVTEPSYLLLSQIITSSAQPSALVIITSARALLLSLMIILAQVCLKSSLHQFSSPNSHHAYTAGISHKLAGFLVSVHSLFLVAMYSLFAFAMECHLVFIKRGAATLTGCVVLNCVVHVYTFACVHKMHLCINMNWW